MKRLALALALAALPSCAAIVGVDERRPGAAPDGGEPANAPAEDAAPPESGDSGASSDAAVPRRPQVLGTFVDPTLSMGDGELVVTERANGRDKVLVFDAKDPTAPTAVYDQPNDVTSKRVTSAAAARGYVWFTTLDGTLHRVKRDGTNPTDVALPPSEILARSPKALWLASPEVLSGAPTLRWLGDSPLAQTPEATLNLSQPVMFVSASDAELVFSSRTSSGQWTLARWRPFGAEPLANFATFDGYPSWVAFDAERVLVYHEDEGRIVAWSRLAPQPTPTTILVDVPAPVAIASDGEHLVLRSQSWIRTCTIASCASTMKDLPTPNPFARARYLALDERWAYFFTSKSGSGPMTLVRAPR